MQSCLIEHAFFVYHLAYVLFPVALVRLQPFIERSLGSFQQAVCVGQLPLKFIHFVLLCIQLGFAVSHYFSLVLFVFGLQLIDFSLRG